MKLTKAQFSDLDIRMNTDKRVELISDWEEVPSSAGECHRSLSISSGGIILTDRIVLTAYPGRGEEGAKAHYATASNYQAARLEIGRPGLYHTNKGTRPTGLPIRVASPHAHLWRDNRLRLQNGSNTADLPLANNLPATVTNWEEAVRWFLTECRVLVPDRIAAFGLPRATTLL